MRYCDSEKLCPGMVLATPLYSTTRELLLARGFELNTAVIERIQKMGLSPVCIEEGGTEGIIVDDVVPEAIYNAAHGSLKEAFEGVIQAAKSQAGKDVEQVVGDLKANGFSAPVVQVKKIVSTLIDELLENMTTEWSVLPLKFVAGDQLRHGVDVAILSLLIGIHFQFRYKELKCLGMGAMLHDLGMTLTPELTQKKKHEFTQAELNQYQKHPQYGVSLLAGQGEILFIEKEIIHQHHEQPDGKGFPRKLMGSHQPPSKHNAPVNGEIFRLAEIVHLADSYLNLTTGRWPLMPISPDDALGELIKASPVSFNAHVVSALSQVIVRFPKGSQVRLMRNHSQRYIGYHGIVGIPNKSEPHKPLIVLIANRFGEKIKPIQVDFSKEKTMEIKLVI
jgi:HD-GYP domain-containing protein (c-di-GMP phosphodiesterase class II)